MKSHDGTIDGMMKPNDKQSLALIIVAKDSLRAQQCAKKWEERVKVIARMNVASKLAKAGMARAQQTLG